HISHFVNSEKEGADTESILFELLLKFGQELTTPYETIQISGTRVFWIPDLNMFFVFEAFTEDMIAPLLSRQPREIVVLDSVFQGSDELKSNLDLHCRDAAVKLTCI
ncbi:MAG TPA: hypothetical protein VGD38_17975, partial [Pyrinomonadaceae bacterium]